MADDTSCIQRIFNQAAQEHTVKWIPPGDYVITSTIFVSASHFAVLGASQTGGKGNTGPLGVRLLWNGPPGGVILQLSNSRDAEISNIMCAVPSGFSAVAGIDIDGDGSTNLLLQNVHVESLGGSLASGIRIGQTAPTGCDLHIFRRLFIRGCGDGMLIVGPQSKKNRIYDSQFLGSSFGIRTLNGSFSLINPNFSSNTTDISIGEVSDSISILDPMSENAQRFLVVGGAECAGLPIHILGGRLAHSNLHLDGKFIIMSPAGPLFLIGVNFASGILSPNWKISASNNCVYSGITHRGVVLAYGCQFPNLTPFTGSHRFITEGCLGVNLVGGAVEMGDVR